jgi:outer membrane protein TolC
MIVEGQVHGGVVQGIGQALWEHAEYDENGQLLSGSMMDYVMPRADNLPRITVGGSAGYSAAELGGLGDAGTFRYAVGPLITWPLLNLGRVKARVDQSRAQAEAADAQYSQTVLRALQEVETGLSRYRTSRARVERIRDAAEASARAADLARLRFEGGVADFLQVLDAERTQLDAEDQLAQAHTDAATSYAALYQALGGQAPTP